MIPVLSQTVTSLAKADQGTAQMSWYLFLFIILLGGIAVSLVLLMLSKNPVDWHHHSRVYEEKRRGNLKTLAESIKLLPLSYEGYAPVRGLMRRLFFEKIVLLRGVSDEDFKKLNLNDAEMLSKYVRDPELIQWLKNPSFHTKQRGVFGFFGQEKVEKKSQYQMELLKILEKMEKWGT